MMQEIAKPDESYLLSHTWLVLGVWVLGWVFFVRNKVFLSSAAAVVTAENDQAIPNCSRRVSQAVIAFQCDQFILYANHS